LYATIGGDTIVFQVVNVRKVEKKYVQFIAIWHLLKQGYSMIDFEAFKVHFKFFKDDNYTCKHCTYSIGWTMVELMHNTILQAIRVAIQKSTFIPMSCDHYLS